MKVIMDLKSDVRVKIEELEGKMADKALLNEAVDKLGEEIAYDINQIESQMKEQKQAIAEL